MSLLDQPTADHAATDTAQHLPTLLTGKTTILYKLKLGEIVTTIPTMSVCLRSWQLEILLHHLLLVGPILFGATSETSALMTALPSALLHSVGERQSVTRQGEPCGRRRHARCHRCEAPCTLRAQADTVHRWCLLSQHQQVPMPLGGGGDVPRSWLARLPHTLIPCIDFGATKAGKLIRLSSPIRTVVSTSRRSSTRTSSSLCGMSEDRTRSDLSGDIVRGSATVARKAAH